MAATDSSDTARIPWRPRDPRWWMGSTVLVLLLAGLVVSELAFDCVSQFWVDHPVAAGTAVGLLFLLLTVFVVQRLLDRQEERRTQNVSATALAVMLREAATVALFLHRLLGWPGGIESPEWRARFDEMANDPQQAHDAAQQIRHAADHMADTVQDWGAQLTVGPAAERMSEFAGIRDHLYRAAETLGGPGMDEEQTYRDLARGVRGLDRINLAIRADYTRLTGRHVDPTINAAWPDSPDDDPER